jgi:uncharacterized membrane protein YphA (DoxX/SURF4 family)
LILKFFDREGSTRGAGLMRIGLALLCWSRWSDELLPFHGRGPQHWLLGLSFFLSTTLLLLGLWSRLAAVSAGVTLLYMFLEMGLREGHEPWTHHHTTLLTFAVCFLALVPCGGSYSMDRWLAIRRSDRLGLPRPAERGPLWALPLFGIQLSAVYFWGAYDKTAWGFLSGARMQHHLMGLYLGSDPLPGWLGWLMFGVALLTVMGEYSLAFTLWIPRLRGPSIVAGIVLHFLFYYLIPVGTFSLTMVVMYIAFLDQDRLHAWLDDFMSPTPLRSTPPLDGGPGTG